MKKTRPTFIMFLGAAGRGPLHILGLVLSWNDRSQTDDKISLLRGGGQDKKNSLHF
jgi:hypothetical protein